jgi:hypothetical protein
MASSVLKEFNYETNIKKSDPNKNFIKEYFVDNLILYILYYQTYPFIVDIWLLFSD